MVEILRFSDAKFKTSERQTACKNCDDWSGDTPKQTVIPAYAPRIVLSGGWGPGSRHLSLCIQCATLELERLRQLENQLERAILSAP